MNKEFEDYRRKNNNRINKIDPIQLEEGQLFQDWVKDTLKDNGIFIEYYKSEIFQREFGEGPSGFEIKLDKRSTGYDTNKPPTNRLSIEYNKEYKNRYNVKNWMKSGILNHAKLKYYVQGTPDTFWIFERDILETLLNLRRNSSRPFFERKEHKTDSEYHAQLRSYLLPFEYCDKFANIKFTNINDKMVMLENKDVIYNLETLKEEIENSIKKLEQSIKELFS